MEDQPKPLWIPIVGYLIVAGALGSLGSMIVSIFTGSGRIDLGFLFIFVGAGFIQHHRISAKIVAGCSILASIIGLYIFIGAIFFSNGIEGPNFFGDWAYGLRVSVAIISVVTCVLATWLAKAIHKNKKLFTNTEATFHIRNLNRNAIPPVVTIVIMVILSSLTEYFTLKREALFSTIRSYEIKIHPKDAETGEVLYHYVGHRPEAYENGGFVRSAGIQSGSDGITLHYIATPPLKGVIRLSHEDYHDVEHEYELGEGDTFSVMEIPMQPLSAAEKKERDANSKP